MPNFAVNTAFDIKDRGILGFFKRLSLQAKTFGTSTDDSFKKASKSALDFKGIVGGILTAGVITRGLGALKTGVREVTEEFITFDQAISSAAAKLDVRRGTREFRELAKAAREVGATTEFTATQAGQALDELVKAGFNQQQAMKAVAGTTDLATIANIDLNSSAAIAVGALNAFGMASEDSEQRLKNLTHINDVFSRTVNSSATDIGLLNETMIQAGPIFKTVGSDLGTFATLAGAVARANLTGSLAGTTLKNSLLALVSITPKAQKAFDKLRIQTIDPLTGDLKDPIQLMSELADATQKMGTGVRGAALDTIFGRKAISGVSKVLELGGDWLRKYRDDTINTGKTARQVADDMRQSYRSRLDVVKSSLVDVGFQFIDAFKDKGSAVIALALNMIRKIDVKAIIGQLRKFGFHVSNILQLLDDLSPIIWGVVGALVAYKGIMVTIAAVQAIQMFLGIAKALQAAAAAQGLLNLAMNANPIMLLVTAIGLIIMGVVALYKNWDVVKEKLAPIGRGIMRVVVNMRDGIINLSKAVMRGLGNLWDWFSKMLDNPFFAALATMFLPFITVPALIIKHWEPIKDFFKGLWRDIKVGADWLGKVFGFSADVAPSEDKFEAPNRRIEEAKQRQSLDVSGTMTFVNPPKNASFESDFFEAPQIKQENLGYN